MLPSFFYVICDGVRDVRLAGANGDAVSSDARAGDGASDGVYGACASNGAVCANGVCDAHDGASDGVYGDAHAFGAYDARVSCDGDVLPYIIACLHLPYNQSPLPGGSKDCHLFACSYRL